MTRLLQVFGAGVLLAALALAFALHAVHASGWALAVIAITALVAWIYLSPRCMAWRYIAPGALAALLFIVFPMVYTLGISFTNYSAEHLLSFERATDVLLARGEGDGRSLAFTLEPADKGQQRLHFEDEDGQRYASAAFTSGEAQRLPLQADAASAPRDATVTPHDATAPTTRDAASAPQDAASAPSDATRGDLRALVAALPALRRLTPVLPDGSELRLLSLRRFSVERPAYVAEADGTLRATRDGRRLTADTAQGWWRHADGSTVTPGFRATVGFANYRSIFTESRFYEPFARVFAWTVSFAALNTLFTFAIGLLLAVALNWPALKGKAVYRIALFLPYAVPAFISIPVFRGLFNENLGEINLVLDLLFGLRPGWFSDATLARAMVLIVNTWLGYPYMMILCMGLIKAIPAELYEASALVGAGPLMNLWRITLPLIARPIAPLLVASFATNFNNLTLIALLTNGAPDYLDTAVPVGATDLLASYTYRIAFQDSGQHYALACAIASLVFLIVATLALANLRLFKVGRTAY
ncbi:maltose ABC transporter permease MalF [Aquabacterium sp.]|uniref:maltose ABC transporter permease MalF n=1 Tax=Aquabacterium sp. TaxID=1872578 RepID=UPI002CA8844E|nr:maltose ABC transporter permease MalF [Aquabacterium sp.]HSW04387.1 maltose ABC transporter permease MalF [Aquabacterium sp.]